MIKSLKCVVLCCLLAFVASGSVAAQSAIITGKVADSTTQQPLAYASVDLLNKLGQVL